MKHCLTFLRHGESEGNLKVILQGQTNSPLTERGRQQARQVAERWQAAGVQFDVIITSPLERTRETAEIVAGVLGFAQEPCLDPVWIERSFGDLEGKTLAEIGQIEPPVDYNQVFEPVGGSGESQTDLYIRATQGLQGILRRPPGRYLIVSHGALLARLAYALLGITPQGRYNNPMFALGNCAYINASYNSQLRQFVIYGFNNPAEWDVQKG
jgi:broad specificity phosphatase PhoE